MHHHVVHRLMHRYVIRRLGMFLPNLSQLSPINGRRHARAAAVLPMSARFISPPISRGKALKFPCDQ
jgi:hypothetical protein